MDAHGSATGERRLTGVFHQLEQRRLDSCRVSLDARDILVDLEKEMYGYRRQAGLIEALRDLVSEPSTETDVIELLSEAYEQIAKLLPKETDAANSAWLEDVESAMKEGNV